MPDESIVQKGRRLERVAVARQSSENCAAMATFFEMDEEKVYEFIQQS
jgi:hypothetical protein